MRTTDFSALAASAPLNTTAAVVRDAIGEHWDPEVTNSPHHWSAPPPMLSGAKLKAVPHLLPLGLRKGRLTVVGLLDFAALNIERGAWGKAIYVCRCTCGDYTGRRRKKLIDNPAAEDMCFKCTRLRQLQINSARPSTSKTRRKDAKRLERLIARSQAVTA